MQVMHCEYFILIKPSISSCWTLFAQWNLQSGLGSWDVTDETFKQKKKDKAGNAMLSDRILTEKQTNKSFWGLLRGWAKLKFESSPSSLPLANSAASRRTRSGHR